MAGSRRDEAFAVHGGTAVYTDMVCRGPDYARIDDVILLDMTACAVDCVHRPGRITRAGRSGSDSSVFIKNDKTIAESL